MSDGIIKILGSNMCQVEGCYNDKQHINGRKYEKTCYFHISERSNGTQLAPKGRECDGR